MLGRLFTKKRQSLRDFGIGCGFANTCDAWLRNVVGHVFTCGRIYTIYIKIPSLSIFSNTPTATHSFGINKVFWITWYILTVTSSAFLAFSFRCFYRFWTPRTDDNPRALNWAIRPRKFISYSYLALCVVRNTRERKYSRAWKKCEGGTF